MRRYPKAARAIIAAVLAATAAPAAAAVTLSTYGGGITRGATTTVEFDLSGYLYENGVHYDLVNAYVQLSAYTYSAAYYRTAYYFQLSSTSDVTYTPGQMTLNTYNAYEVGQYEDSSEYYWAAFGDQSAAAGSPYHNEHWEVGRSEAANYLYTDADGLFNWDGPMDVYSRVVSINYAHVVGYWGWATSVTGLTAATLDEVHDTGKFSVDFAGYGGVSWNPTPFAYTHMYLTFDRVARDVSSAAPEPSAWALLIAGFGLAGAALRRKRMCALNG